MLARVRELLRSRPLVGVLVSVAIHLALVFALLGVHPTATPKQKRGDALIVELPSIDEPASAGTPGPRADEPPSPAPSAPAPPAPAPKAPPAPRVAPAPPARPRVARPTPPAPEPREAPKAVASAPQPPAAPERGDVPAAKSAPQPPSPPQTAAEPQAATPPQPATPPQAASPPADAAPPAPPTPPAVASAPPGPVAMVPPAPDIRSAMRRGGGGGGTGPGGAGGVGTGRGGIVGEPVALDAKDSELTDYLERIKRQIKQNWVYPCVKNQETSVCEYKSTELVIEFGILKPGPVQYVEVRRASPYGIYDAYAVNAIKLASPFPPVPAVLMSRMAPGSTGAAITARFVYYYETGLTNVLR